MQQTTADNFETLSVRDLAEMLKVRIKAIYEKCESNEIPHFRIGKNGNIRFLKSSILQWIESQQNINKETSKINKFDT